MVENTLTEPIPNPKPKGTMALSVNIKTNSGLFHGYKLVYLKTIYTKDDKENKQEKLTIDHSKPVIYGERTQQLLNNKQNPIILSDLLLSNNKLNSKYKQQMNFNTQLLLQINQLKQQLKGGK